MILSIADLPKALERRAYGYCVKYNRYGYYKSCKGSVWSRFGRWILASVLIFVAISIVIVTVCCLLYRKRKNRRMRANSASTNNVPQTSSSNYDAHYYQPPPDAPPKYSEPETNGGVPQPQNAHFQ